MAGANPRWPRPTSSTPSPTTRERIPPCSPGRYETGSWPKAFATRRMFPASVPLTGNHTRTMQPINSIARKNPPPLFISYMENKKKKEEAIIRFFFLFLSPSLAVGWPVIHVRIHQNQTRQPGDLYRNGKNFRLRKPISPVSTGTAG